MWEKGQVLISGCVPIEATVFKEDWPKQYFVRAQGEITMTVPSQTDFLIRSDIYQEEKRTDENIVPIRQKKRETDQR